MEGDLASAGTAGTPPSVLAVVEMNLEEYPAFRLGRRSKRPELRYGRTRTDADGRVVEQLWIVRGVEGLGLPGPFEQDLYVALLVLFTEQGLPSDGRIRFTRNRVAQIMDISNSGRGYELIEQGLSRLAAASIHTEHAFYRPSTMTDGKRAGPTERLSLDFHILDEVRVYERAASFIESLDPVNAQEPMDPDASRLPRLPRVERARPFELSVARLGLPLVQSYERRYTKPLDATFYFTLTRPLAKRLYRYVDKVRNGRGSFEIGLRPLADVLGLEYRYPSDIKDGLAEAHLELREHGYLTSAGYAPLSGGPTAGEKVVYAFNPAFDQRPKRRAGSLAVPSPASQPGLPEPPPVPAGPVVLSPSPAASKKPVPTTTLQITLEEFGITPKRAAALVDAFPESHIQARLDHVRALMRDKHARPLRNPAGYLAKAIEDSFSVPQSPPAVKPVPVVAPTLRLVEPVTDAPFPSVEPSSSPEPELEFTGVWGDLARVLKERLSGASYAAWVLPAHGEETAAGQLKILVPSAFAIERWHRPPLAAALAEAATSLGIHLTIEVAPPTEEHKENT